MEPLRRWLAAHGGSFGERVLLDVQGPFGVSVRAPKPVVDTTIVACPLSLIITRDVASEALATLLHVPRDAWTERQWISTYLSLHHVCPHPVLRHLPYVASLPVAETLSTPLYFTTAEREVLRGTNLFGATLDRERDWRAEWATCRSVVHSASPAWGEAFTWERYLTAATHLSSRAFPSSILSATPTLVATPATHPVLIPGLDLLNHKRGQPVSWIVDSATISLVAHPDSDAATPDGLVEVFNNYGPKPNDELVLGYGFTLKDNPDDTITLQIGGSPTSQKWVVGRDARNVDGLWSDIQGRIVDGQNEHPFEDDLDTAAALSDMVQAKLDGMRTVADVQQNDQIRPSIRAMLEHYIAGQREILESILEYSDEKQQAAIETASEQGIHLVFDDDDVE